MFVLQLLAKFLTWFFRKIWHRSGGTWPGEIALALCPNLLRRLRDRFKTVIVVTGTNGKTSTTHFLVRLFKAAGEEVVTNQSGANLINGVASAFLTQLPLLNRNKKPIGIFEVDELAFVKVGVDLKPDFVILLNLFRDQLDRYGELTNILLGWQQALQKTVHSHIIYLSSDPALQSLFLKLENPHEPYRIPQTLLRKQSQIASDYTHCPRCKEKLKYTTYYLGHIGRWYCQECGFAPPKQNFEFELKELALLKSVPPYQQINLEAVYLLAKRLQIKDALFWNLAKSWQPSFGRGEVIVDKSYHRVVYLGKNPSGWVAILDQLDNKILARSVLVMGLNNRIPDGKDISWIYDVPFKLKARPKQLIVFGDRAYDLAIRLKLAGYQVNAVFNDLKRLKLYLQQLSEKQQLFIVNYSAMLELRRLLIKRYQS